MKRFSKWFGRDTHRAPQAKLGRPSQDISDALLELQRFTDRELADVALARSDLSEEGLRIAGDKRRRR